MIKHVIAIAVLLLACSAFDLSARLVTLTAGGTKTNDSISIGTNEFLTIQSVAFPGQGYLVISKDGMGFHTVYFNSAALKGTAIAGPASVTLDVPSGQFQLSFVTVEIQSEIQPPDKTLVLPQGSGANVRLESSTNLVDWTAVPPGAYTNSTANLFFRIRADRIP